VSDFQIIRVDDAKALVRVGVPEPERAAPQEVRISVVLGLAEVPAYGESADRIGATVDYMKIIRFIRDDLGAPAHLVETLADRVAGHCLALSTRARWVEVTVKKPSVLSGDGLVSVTIRREAASK
jgi:FolB domain-containing protein